MKQIQIENEKAIQNYMPKVFELYENFQRQKEDTVVEVNQEYASVIKDGRCWYLNSHYSSQEACEIWAQQLTDINSNGMAMIAGLGNGLYIKKFIEKVHKDVLIIVYEPDVSIFIEAMKNVDLTDIIRRCNIFVDKINDVWLPDFINMNLNNANLNYTSLHILPNYGIIYNEKINKFKEIITNEISNAQLNRNTSIKYANEFYDNILKNLWMLVSNSSVYELSNSIKASEKISVPAVIVAAGPSLNKNIKILKEYKDRLFIIACDSAINPLLNENIIPDIAVSVDSHKPLSNFKDERVKDIAFVLGSQCISWFKDEHRGKKFFFIDSYTMAAFFKDVNKEFGMVESGGSVANDAFSLAEVLGFKDIILIGQDLAYSDGIYYANGIVDKQEKVKYKKEDMYEVEGYYGGKVVTEFNLDAYRKWFERQIVKRPFLHVINATEGGALIHGADNMTLKNACEKYCNEIVDFKTIINNIPNAFSKQELEDIKNKILNYGNVINDLRELINSNIEDFNKIESLILQNKISKELTQIYQRISDRISKMEHEYVLNLATTVSKGMEYNVINDLYEDTGSEIEDLKNTVKKGIELQKVYSKSLDILESRLPELYKTLDENI